jgi:ABC-type uncharacterized transport system substrate-binding protein
VRRFDGVFPQQGMNGDQEILNKAGFAQSGFARSPGRLLQGALLAMAMSLAPVFPALAHPHVYIDANLEIARDDQGRATEIRHVWRFDEIFSSSVALDFDDDGDGKLSLKELEEVASTVRKNIAEFNFYTEVRDGDEVINFYEPDPFLADFVDGQLIFILALELEKPQPMTGGGFRVAVSDPTYYVAIEFNALAGITVSGKGGACKSDVVVPDWDALFARDAERINKLFSAPADATVDASDDYLTWVNFTCSK